MVRKKESVVRKGEASGMAAEFFVMSQLYRAGHLPSLTLGNAKAIDILVKTKSHRFVEVSVKAVQSYGKWGIGKARQEIPPRRIYCLLHYKKMDELSEQPDVYVVPGAEIKKRVKQWHNGWAFYFNKKNIDKIERWKNGWSLIR